MLSLAVTSSTSVVGAAVGPLGADQGDVASEHVETDRRHAEELTPLVQRVLAEFGVRVGDVEVFVADVGPGRFTGLRVGLATVRTLALAADRPVIPVTSFEALAWAEVRRPLVAVIDARRGEVFQQRFDDPCPAPGTGDPLVGPAEELAPFAVGAAVIVGDGADRYAEAYGPAVVADRIPAATAMLAGAAGRAPVGGPEARPLYLRTPDVNVNVKTRPGA